ncbi:hypothetical protein [Nocardia sp. NPDC003183]
MSFPARIVAAAVWIKSNFESAIAIVLAVTLSVLGLVDPTRQELLTKVIPLTLGVIAFAVLRDRWRQEAMNAQVRQSLTDIAHTLDELNDRRDRASAIDELLTSTQRTLDSLSAVRFAKGDEVSDVLAEARTETDRWIFKGGTGAHTRVVTLPDCLHRAHRNRRELLVRLEILDPTDRDLCSRYAALYRSLAEGDDDDARTWTAKGTQIEVYATIAAACWHKQRLPQLLDIQIGLTSSVSLFRWDLSTRFLIVTQRGPRFPAMIIERDRPYYDSWNIELRTSFAESRPVAIDRATSVRLDDDPTVEQVRDLFDTLGMGLPGDFDDADVTDIITKALQDHDRAVRGAGDTAA